MRCLILGHGYMAVALAREAGRRDYDLFDNKLPCSKIDVNHLLGLIEEHHPDIVINSAAFIPPSGRVVDCDQNRCDSIQGNVLFPATVRDACKLTDTPLVHISTGCLYDEAKEYEETDKPLRGWDGYCGTYVGCKLLAEKLVLEHPKSYVLRVRLPFDEVDHPRNYLSKLASFSTVFDHVNSLTHRGDFAKAALDLVELNAAPGVYHMVNPGAFRAYGIIMGMQSRGILGDVPKIIPSDVVKGTRLSTKKLLSTGVTIRPVEEALFDALNSWRKP